MKVNPKLLPIKAHYFCFMGCAAPIMPFVFVVGTQLGIPVFVTGVLTSASLMTVVVMKPIVAALSDAFPSCRPAIFLFTVTLMVASLSSLYFIPPMDDAIVLEGRLVKAQGKHKDPQEATPKPQSDGRDGTRELLLWAGDDDGRCFVAEGWECKVRCVSPETCLTYNSTTDGNYTLHSTFAGAGAHNSTLFTKPFKATAVGTSDNYDVVSATKGGSGGRLYRLDGVNISPELLSTNIRVECGGGQREGGECPGVWSLWQFWVFAFLLLLGTVAFKTCVSINDAITVDTIGQDGDYGMQRAFGTVGWGLVGMLSGVTIDWWSGSSLVQDYTPAFVICFVLGAADVVISSTAIKVPKIQTETNLMRKLVPILRQPRFIVFCAFVILSGAFNLISNSFIFVMQEDMLKGTAALRNIKLIHGLTLLAQCGSEAPFMAINKWFMRQLGAHYVLSLTFCLFILRLFGLGLAGFYWPVWMTLVVELLNGPCYGLSYTAIVIYSSQISPPGTSTTVQSLTNLCYESFGFAGGMLGGGVLYSSLGGPKMYMVCGTISVATFLLHLLSLRVFPPPTAGENAVKFSSPEEEKLKKEDEEDGSPRLQQGHMQETLRAQQQLLHQSFILDKPDKV